MQLRQLQLPAAVDAADVHAALMLVAEMTRKVTIRHNSLKSVIHFTAIY